MCEGQPHFQLSLVACRVQAHKIKPTQVGVSAAQQQSARHLGLIVTLHLILSDICASASLAELLGLLVTEVICGAQQTPAHAVLPCWPCSHRVLEGHLKLKA